MAAMPRSKKSMDLGGNERSDRGGVIEERERESGN